MSLVYCDCDNPATALTVIPAECITALGDLWKLAFQRASQAGAADVATFQTVAYWTGLKAAADSTKVTVTGKVFEGTIPEASQITDPSHNNGEDVIGFAAQRLVTMVKFPSSAMYDALASYVCEPNMAFCYIDANSNILAKENGTSPKFIPIDGLVTMSPPQKEFGGSIRSMLSFNLPTNWYSDTKLFQLSDGDAKFDI